MEKKLEDELQQLRLMVDAGAAEDALSLLESDQLAGIPKSPHTLLDLLLEAKVLVAVCLSFDLS